MKAKLNAKALGLLRKEIMDSIGSIDIDLLATDKSIQSMIREIHYELMDISIVETNF